MSGDTWDFIWESYKNKAKWNDQTRLIFEIISNIKSLRNMNILEAGSGSGLISRNLADSNELILIDKSIKAIKLSKSLFNAEDKKGHFICASIFNLPIRDKVIDLCWNAGVLEHFKEDLREIALNEMLRVGIQKGHVISINNSFYSIPYRIGKFVYQLRGKWIYGQEFPIKSLKKLQKIAKNTKEYYCGFLNQWDYLYSLKPFMPFLFFRILKFFKRHLWALNRLPGLFLVSIFTLQ